MDHNEVLIIKSRYVRNKYKSSHTHQPSSYSPLHYFSSPTICHISYDFSPTSRLTMESIHPSIHWVWKIFILVIKWPRNETDSLPLSSIKVKNALPYTISGDAAEFTNMDTMSFCMSQHTTAAAAAVVSQPKSSLTLLNALPPGFSMFDFSFSSSCVKQWDGIISQSIFPSFPGFSYPFLAVIYLLQGFLWHTMFLHSDCLPFPTSSSLLYLINAVTFIFFYK